MAAQSISPVASSTATRSPEGAERSGLPASVQDASTVPGTAGERTARAGSENAVPENAVSEPAGTTTAGTASEGTTSTAAGGTEKSTTAIDEQEVTWTPPSWDEVVRQHADRVYRLAFRLSGNQHDAEDLTQETFIRVFRSLASYKPGTFEGWLHRITTNLFLDLARRRSRLRMEGLPEDTDRLASSGRSPEQVFHDTHLDPDLQTALDDLPPEFRVAVVLCDVEGLSYEEIGATLDVKLGTVRSRIHRGRQMLKAALETRREHAREDSE